MEYRAKKAYQNKDVVFKYNEERFKSLKGSLVNKRELSLIHKALSYAGIVPPSKIIDTPCGTGRLAIILAQEGFEVRGVDLSLQMISYTKEKIKNLNLANKITVEVGNAESLPYQEGIFDACVCLRLLGHTPFEARRKILAEFKRVVKKNLILVYYHKNCLQHFLRKHQRKKNKIAWHPVTYKEIEKELKSIGLEKIRYFHLFMGISETIVVLAKKKDVN